MKDQMAEKDVEIKIIKREREDFLSAKLEIAMDNKRLKVIISLSF
jgi:hypothetical protein